MRPRRRDCDHRHPLETPYAQDGAEKCARIVQTPKVLPIAFLDRRSASAAATTRLARQLPIVGHDSPRRTSGRLQFRGDLVKSAPGAHRRRTPVFAPSTTVSKRVKTRQRGFDHRRPRQAFYATNTFGTLLSTFQTPTSPPRADPHLQRLQHRTHAARAPRRPVLRGQRLIDRYSGQGSVEAPLGAPTGDLENNLIRI